MEIKSLTRGQKQTRRRILGVSFKRKLSHIGSCLCAIDLIDAVYRVKKKDEKFVLSCGHAGIALYVVLEKCGLIKASEVEKLNVHPDRDSRLGIDVSTGSLGQGLPIALGVALADRSRDTFCIISDGECAEGSTWETLRIAAEQKVDNLKIILNANGWSAYDPIMLPPIIRRLKAFGCRVVKVGGHNLKEIVKALKLNSKGRFTVVFAETSVEQFPFLKGLDAHYYIMTEDDYKLALKLLE